MKKFSLRLLAVILTVTLLAANFVTTITALGDLGVSEQGASAVRDTVKVTDAQIVAEYGFISEGEKAVLNCNAIIGKTHVIPVPSDSDELVSIDAENKTVSAKSFTDSDYTWLPVKAYLVYQDAIGSEVRIPVVLDGDGKGSFETDAESYSIEVDYEVKVAIDFDTQRDLANAPAALVNGIANLEAAAACEDKLNTIASDTVFSALLKMTETMVVGSTEITPFKNGSLGYTAIKAMEADRRANGGTFALCNAIAAYKQSANKVEYLVNNGNTLRSACSIAQHLTALTDEDEGLGAKLSGMEFALALGLISQQDLDNLKLLNEILTTLVANLGEIKEENWAVLDNSPVNPGATALELEALDMAVAAAKGRVSTHDDAAFVAAPVAATATVKAGVAQSYVNVKVSAQVVDATNKLSDLEGKSARFLIKDGATEKEIKDKIEALGIRQETLAYWTENASVYNIDSDYYVYDVKVAYNETTGETDVEITYTPKTYTITSDFAEEMTVPYGYKYQLAAHSDSTKSYDYKVNGEAKYQGDIITVAENLSVTRVEGVALKGTTVNAIIAESTVGALLSPEAANILKVNGFKVSGNENLFGAIRYRVPTVASLKTTEVENGYKVTASSVNSGTLAGSVWNAVSVDLLDDNGAILASYEVVNGVAEFVYEGAFANAKVNFELVVKDINADSARVVANLPYVLTTEADAQLAILNRMADGSLYSALSSLSAENINLIVTVVNASKMSQAAKDAVSLLKTDCVDVAGNILLYSYLSAYKTAKEKGAAEGLKYYYTANNAANMKNQLNVLSGVFNALCPADVNNADRKIFTDLLTSNGLASYVEKLDSIRTAIDDCKDIAPVNVYVDNNGASLGALTSAICNAIGKTAKYTDEKSAVLSSSIICAAPDKATVNIVINVVKGDGTTDSYKDTLTLPNGSVIGDLLQNKFNDLNDALAIDKDYYNVEGIDAIPSGDIVINDITSDIIVTYTPYSYTVSVPGAADQSFYYDADWSITLPASPNNSTKLVYTVAGETVEVVQEAVRYTFDSLKSFGADRHLDVTVESVDLETEKFLTFIDILNEAVGEVGGRFIPVKDDAGNIVIVFRTSSDISSAIDSGVLTNLPMALAMYGDVKLGGNTFWDGTAVHLQAMTDMVANSQFSLDLLCQIIREDGSVVNDAALGALEPMIDADGNIGGKLMVSSISLDGRDFGFYVTLSDTTSASMLAKMRSAVAKVKDYVNIVCDDGQFQFIINAPDAVYPYYLAQMLVSGNVDITDISALNLRDSIRYEWGLISQVLSDDRLSVETFENTFAALGKDVDLSRFDGLFNNFKKANSYLESNIEVRINDEASDKYSATFLINLNGVFNKVATKFDLPDTVMSLIYEADPEAERFEIDFSVKLANIIDKDYDAIVFDINGEGITKKFYCTNDLASTLNNLGNYGIVVLTSDATLDKDVYIKGNAVIDLNGFTLTGNIATGGTVRIVDSRLGVEEAGGVDGKLEGNFILTGGKYTSDISAHLNKGYYVNENGYVRNKIYSINKNGNDIEIALSAAYINDTTIVDLQAVLVDVAVDIAMSAYTGAAISVDGNYIYNFSAKDITAILGGGKTNVVNSIIDILDTEGLSNVINSVVSKVTDFEGLASAINNNEALAEFELSIESWDMVAYIADGNYITFDSVASKENSKTGVLSVVIEGTEQEKAELAALCDDLSVIEVNAFNLNLGNIEYGNGFSVELNGEVAVHINLAKNRAYAALVCASAAYSSSNTSKKALYVAALNEYLAGNGSNAIMAVLETMTAKEMISALKAIDGVSCEKLLKSIGINVDKQTDEIIRLFGSYDNIVKIGSRVLSKLDVTGNGASLASHKVKGSFATYKFETKLVDRISVTLSITTVSEFGGIEIEDLGMAEGVTNETVKSFRDGIDLGNGLAGMALDISRDGMTVNEFVKLFAITVTGAIDTDFAILGKNGKIKAGDTLVGTGDTLIVTAFDGLKYQTMERTVVIVGDTDGDGQTTRDDASDIANLKLGLTEMSAAEQVAADINGNGRIDVGDAARVCYKVANDWAEYIG